MKKILEKLQGLALLCLGVCFTFPLQAVPLAGQAGGDTVSRAQAPESVVKPKEVQDAKPAEEASKANAKDAVRIGVIERLHVAGDFVFIEREGVTGILQEKLCDGAEKTIGDLRQTFADVKAKLAERGYYVVYIYPRTSDAYDTETKTLYLTVDPARFGTIW